MTVTHSVPLESEGLDEVFHTFSHPMRVFSYPLPPFDIGPFGSIKNEEGKKWHAHEPCTAKEHGANFGIFSLSPICRMKKPNRCINAYAITSFTRGIGLETIDD
jgi:hypothetical protein